MPQAQDILVEPREDGANPTVSAPVVEPATTASAAPIPTTEAAPIVWDDLPPEQKAKFKRVSNPVSPQDPLLILPPDKYVDFMVAHPKDPSLNPDQWALDHPDQLSQPGIEGKLADITAIAEHRGVGGFFEALSNMSPGEIAASAAKGVYHFGKGAAETLVRAGERIQTPVQYPLQKYVGHPLREKLGVTKLLNKVGIKDEAPSMEREAVKDIETLSSVESSQRGFMGMLRHGLEKGGAFLGRLGLNKIGHPPEEGGTTNDPYGIVNFFTPPEEKSPGQRVDHFRSLVARAGGQRAAAVGEGSITTALTGGVAKSLADQGFKVDPDKIASLSAGDPLAVLEFGGAFRIVGAAGKTLATVATRSEAAQLIRAAQAAQRNLVRAKYAEQGAESELSAQRQAFTQGGPLAAPGLAEAPDALRAAQAATAEATAAKAAAEGAVSASPVASGVRAVSKNLVEPLQSGIRSGLGAITGEIPDTIREGVSQVVSKAAEKTIGAGLAAIGVTSKGIGNLGDFALSFLPPIATPRRLIRTAEGFQNIGQGLAQSGKALFTNPEAVSPKLRLLSDVAKAVPSVAAGAAKGFLTVDLPLAAVGSEFPSDASNIPALGAAFGAFGGSLRGAQGIVQGQEARPFTKQWRSSAPIRDYRTNPTLDAATRETLSRENDPGVTEQLSAMRQAFDPLGVEVHYIKDAALPDPDHPNQSMLRTVLEKIQPGMDPGWYQDAAQQRGVTLTVNDRLGNPKPVIILSDIEAGLHEGVHAIEKILGPTASAQIHKYIQDANAPIWEQVGQSYVNRFSSPDRFLKDYVARGEGWREALLDSSFGTRDWRKTMTPQEIDDAANFRVSEEILAEAGDTVLRNKGPALLDDPGLSGKLARTLAKVLVGMGIEPFAGVRSEGQGIPIGYETAKTVQEALRTGIERNAEQQRFNRVNRAGEEPPPVQPRGGKPSTPPVSPRDEAPATPATPTEAADTAREIASRAPTTPSPRGTRSQRAILEDVANAIESRNGLVVDYASAPDEPAGSITSNRVTRRAVIEAFRNMPATVRALWEKNFYPERVVETSKGAQIIGWTPEVFAANAHKLAAALAKAKKTKLSPYPIDAKTGSFTEHGWRQLFEDAQAFMSNQQGGRTGSGESLVVPPEVTARGFTAPAETGGVRSLSQGRADVISALFGIKLPKTPRVGNVFPRNLAGQEVSEATLPGRTSVPVEPRAPFAGPKAAEMGIEGREIREVNPFRAELEAAGVKVDAIEAIQRLNVNRIVDVTPMPAEPVPFRANEFTLQAGFQPKASDRALYDDLVGQIGKLPLEDQFGAKGSAIRQQIEDLKNRNGGNPPESAATESAQFQPRKKVKDMTDREYFDQLNRDRDAAEAAGQADSQKWHNKMDTLRGQATGELYTKYGDTALEDLGHKKFEDLVSTRMNELGAWSDRGGFDPANPEKVPLTETSGLGDKVKFQPKTDAGRALEDDGFAVERTGFPGYRAVTIRKDGKVVGEILSSRSHENADEVVIGGVDVQPSYRRQGIGEAMYRELLTDLQEDGVKTVTGYPISAPPIKLRERLLPGTRYEAAGKSLTMEEAMAGTPEVAKQLGLPAELATKMTSKLPANAKFQPATDAGRKLEDDGFKITRKTFTEHGDYATRVEVHNDKGERVGYIETMDLPPQEAGEVPTAEIMMVKVEDKYKRKGMAETLYREALTDLQKQGIKQVTGFIISEGPAKIREKLLPGLSQFSQAGQPISTADALKQISGRYGVETSTRLPEDAKFQPKPNDEVRAVAATYTGKENVEPKVIDVDPKLAARIADYYENAKSNPDDKRVKASYDALTRETVDQWKAIEDAGYTLEPWEGKGEPYKTSAEMTADVRDNKHLYFLPTSSAMAKSDSNNPMLADSGINGLPFNDVFRAVHDFFGHAKEGYQFGPKGELNAWKEHSEMYSPEAQGALAAETLAQNSWVNYGKHIRDVENPLAPAERPFAEQKNIVIPDEMIAAAKGGNATMRFSPKKDEPRAVKSAAISIERPGKKAVIVEGSIHADAYEKAFDQGLLKEGPDDAHTYDGFVTNAGEFLDREQAYDRARELRQLTARDARSIDQNFGTDATLESQTFDRYRKFQPKKGEPEQKATGWILPNGKYEPLTSDLHENDLAANRERYNKQFGTSFGSAISEKERNKALQAGFVRVRTTPNGDMTIEMHQKYAGKQKGPAQAIALRNADRLNELSVNVINDKGRFVDGGSENIYMADDPTSTIKELFSGIKGGAADVAAEEPTAIQRARAFGQTRFQPRREETGDLDLGLPPTPLSTRDISTMTQKDKRVYYPEAVVPKSSSDLIPSDITGSPLKTRAGNDNAAVDAFAKRLVEFARENENEPAYQLGTRWYSDFTPMLQKRFGKDAKLMAELLAATSPNTNPQVNFGYAYDALRSMQTERFKKIVPKFNEGLEKMEDGSWESWYAKELKAGNVKAPPENPSPASYMAHWIDKYDLKPRQSNGALYGMHGVRVLQVLARRWMDLNAGPKTRNFVGNLLGTTKEATIDVWADRTMRWAGYEGAQDRWRILPENATGVSDEDFAFGQLAFRRAAKQLGITPDALQGGLWFAEKKRWADNGWGRLDLGDFRTEMEKLPLLESGFNTRVKRTEATKRGKTITQTELAVEPRVR